jgi:hypothetical protein
MPDLVPQLVAGPSGFKFPLQQGIFTVARASSVHRGFPGSPAPIP